MRIPFRQGVVSHQSSGFLNYNGLGNVDVFADQRPVTVAIADKGSNYIFTEDANVQNAWVGPFDNGKTYWLYWKFHTGTFARTFESTDIEPITQAFAPTQILLRSSQNQTNYNGVGTNGAFTGGDGAGPTAYAVNDTITLTNGSVLVVKAIDGDGDVAAFDVLTRGANPVASGQTLTQQSTTGSGLQFSLTTGVVNISSGLQQGQIWFDTTKNEMFQYYGSGWAKVYYVFSAKVNTGIFSSVSINAPQLTGTQIGNTNSVLTGRVIRNAAGKGIRKDDGTFFTTEDQFFVDTGTSTAVRLESNVIRAQAGENLAEFTIVAFSAPGEIRTAQYNDAQFTICGVLMESLVLNSFGTLVPQGVVTNINWDFSALQVGTPLFIENGLLTSVDPHTTNSILYPTAKTPVARVMSADTILFEQGLGGVGPRGPTGSLQNLPVASTSTLGAVVFATPPQNAAIPIAVGDNDPRLSGGPFASQAHTHAATSITFVPAGTISALNVQNALMQVEANAASTLGDIFTGPIILYGNPSSALEATPKQYVDAQVSSKVAKSGDTMTGLLTLPSDPVDPLQAATKQYVDTRVSKSGDTMSGFLTLSGAPTNSSHAATKGYVDAIDLSVKVDKAGDTMTGPLILDANPTVNLGAATKQYVDNTAGSAVDNSKVLKAGDTMTASLAIEAADPGLNLRATGQNDPRINFFNDAASTPIFQAQVGFDPTGDSLFLKRINAAQTLDEGRIDIFGTYILGDVKFRSPSTVGGDVATTLTTKDYVDNTAGAAVDNSKVLKAGDTMTGPLVFGGGTSDQFIKNTGNNLIIGKDAGAATGSTSRIDLRGSSSGQIEFYTGSNTSQVKLSLESAGSSSVNYRLQDGAGTDIFRYQQGIGGLLEEKFIFSKKVQSTSTVGGDAVTTLTTKDYVDAQVGGAGPTVLDDLTDVDTTTVAPVDGDVLVYDSTNGWEPKTLYKEIPLSFQGLLPDATTVASVMLTQNYSAAAETATTTGSHRGIAAVAPSGGDAVITMSKNGGPPFITMTIPDGTTTCSFATNAETFVPGDYIEIVTLSQNGAEGIFFSLKIKDDLGV